jgi:hypothetical protein
MFAGVMLAAKPGKATDSSATRTQAKSGARSSFMQRMDQRWDGNQEDRL